MFRFGQLVAAAGVPGGPCGRSCGVLGPTLKLIGAARGRHLGPCGAVCRIGAGLGRPREPRRVKQVELHGHFDIKNEENSDVRPNGLKLVARYPLELECIAVGPPVSFDM